MKNHKTFSSFSLARVVSCGTTCLTLTAALFLASCSGSGSGSENSGGANQGLGDSDSGYIYYSGGTKAKAVNLSTGASKDLDRSERATPAFDGSEWFGFSYARRIDDRIDDLTFYDANGVVKSTMAVGSSLHGYIKPAADKQMLAFMWANENAGESYTEPKLTIAKRNGQILTRFNGATAFTWTAGGKLLVAIGSTLHITSDLGNTSSAIHTFTGKIGDIAVHPDERRIAVSVYVSGTDNEWHIWLINVDGSGLRQFTTSDLNETDAVWVGNTNTLLVRSGVETHLTGPSGCPTLYALDTAYAGIIRPSWTETSYMRKVRYTENGVTSDVCPFSPLVWVPRL